MGCSPQTTAQQHCLPPQSRPAPGAAVSHHPPQTRSSSRDRAQLPGHSTALPVTTGIQVAPQWAQGLAPLNGHIPLPWWWCPETQMRGYLTATHHAGHPGPHSHVPKARPPTPGLSFPQPSGIKRGSRKKTKNCAIAPSTGKQKKEL